MLHVAEFHSSQELRSHYAAVKARRHAAEQGAEMRRRLPAVIAAEPLRAHVVTTRPRAQLPALVMDIRPWEALRPAGYVAPPAPPRITIHAVQRAAARHFGVTRDELISERRTMPLVRYRQVAMFLTKQLTGRSLPEIGRQFGNRDHTTVLHAVRKITELLRHDPKTRDAVAAIEARLGVGPEPPIDLPAFLPRHAEAA